MSGSAPDWFVPLEYRVEQTRCRCFGQQPSVGGNEGRVVERAPAGAAVHTIWVAFLLYDNEEGPGEQSFKDYYLLPWNYMTVLLTGEQFIHCQLVFWDATRRCYFTYSVDGDRAVFVYDRKSFQRGWRFVKLSVTEPQEVLVQNFLIAQLGKILNARGQFALGARQLGLARSGVSGEGESWFCSELVAAALEQAGLLDFGEWPGFNAPADVAPHDLFHYLTERCTKVTAELMAGNPVMVRMIHERRRNEGPLAIEAGVLPQAVADFSTAPKQLYFERALAPPKSAPPRSPLDRFTVKK